MATGAGRRAYAAWLALAGATVALDRLTKEWALAALDGVVEVLPALNFVLVFNSGAAFGLLARAGGWQRWFFIVVGIAIAIAIAVWLRRAARSGRRWLPGGLALVLGGAIGNVWDRLELGAVVDFIDVHFGAYHWPAFNLADAAITTGAAILVLSSLRDPPPEHAARRSR